MHHLMLDLLRSLMMPLYGAGGNQRDLARAKNQKKLAEQNKGKRSESNTSIAARKEADAAALRAKQEVSICYQSSRPTDLILPLSKESPTAQSSLQNRDMVIFHSPPYPCM